MDHKNFIVKSGSKINLKDYETSGKKYFNDDKVAGEADLAKYKGEIDQLQDILYAEHRQRLLIVLQAIDTAGKDGTTRAVFGGINPQGVRIASFKSPTLPELDHDYLWRVHAETPGKGEIVVFNRSHYEDVLVVRVHKLIPEDVWGRRYHQINEFERMLSEEGTTIIKFFLYINKDTQKERLLERINTPEKNWITTGCATWWWLELSGIPCKKWIQNIPNLLITLTNTRIRSGIRKAPDGQGSAGRWGWSQHDKRPPSKLNYFEGRSRFLKRLRPLHLLRN